MPISLQSFELVITAKGNGQAQRTKTIEIEKDSGAADDDAAFATARAAAASMVSAWQLLSGAAVLNWSLRGVYRETGALSIAADLNVYDEAVFSVGLDVPNSKKALMTVFQPLAAIFTGNDIETGQIDIADASVVTFFEQFDNAHWCRLSDGETMLGDILSARVRSVGSGKAY